MADTAISYASKSWSLAAGCDQRGGPGCVYCWSCLRVMPRLQRLPKYRGLIGPDRRWTGEIREFWEALDEPCRWRGEEVVFVCPHSDFALLSPDLIRAAFDIMAGCRQHTFLIVTHHAEALERMLTLCDWPALKHNAYLLPTCETQERADLMLPLALRFGLPVVANLEPMLGAVDVSKWLRCEICAGTGVATEIGSLIYGGPLRKPCPNVLHRQLAGVILGGASGKGAPPLHPDWVRSARDQCQAAGVSFFFKQWGEWGIGPSSNAVPDDGSRWTWVNGYSMYRWGTKAAGHLLDGVAHRELPWGAPCAS